MASFARAHAFAALAWLAPVSLFGCGSETPKPWHACGRGQCATISVPVDYGEPRGKQLQLSVYRAPARARPARGALFFLPGGPGTPVVKFSERIQASLADAFPNLDIVLMDPRGVGESAPIDCMGPEFFEHGSSRATGLDPDDDLERAVGRLSRFWADFEASCTDALGSETLASYHSENVARDLEEARKLVGVPKLHLWAASYATLPATLYAKLFPKRVGAFLLHLPAFRGSTDRLDDVRSLMAAHDEQLGRVLSWCATRGQCGLGETRRDVLERYDALRAELRRGVKSDGRRVPPASLTRAMVLWIDEAARDQIALALSDAARGDWRRIVRRASTDPYFESEDDQLSYWQASAVTELLDFGCPSDYSRARAVQDIEQALGEYPRTADVFAPLFASCVGWKTRPSEQRIVPETVSAPPMLLVAGANDPSTPVAGARALRDQLGNGSELLVSQVEGHGVLYVDQPVTRKALHFIAIHAE